MRNSKYVTYSDLKNIVPIFSYKQRTVPTNVTGNIKLQNGKTHLFNIHNIIENVIFVKSAGGLKIFELTDIESISIPTKQLHIELSPLDNVHFNTFGWVRIHEHDEETGHISATTIGKTPANLFQPGATFNNPSTEIFFDTEMEVFWRIAGKIE